MPNILMITKNDLFYNDIAEQISLYDQEYAIHKEYDADSVYDLVILDDGIDELKLIRKYGFKIPIIYFLSKENKDIPFKESDIILQKPVLLSGFLNLLKSSVYLYDNSLEGYIEFNDYEVRPAAKEILNKRNDTIVKLTEKEVAIIKYLYKANKSVSKTELLQNVWGYSPESMTHTIETHIYRLRNKVEDPSDETSQIILTIDAGYRLNREIVIVSEHK